MKKIILLAMAAIMAAGAIQAKNADEIRVYLNPGHGSWGPNDRPMATIPYPADPATGRPDTCGFYESNTNLWKAKQTRTTLIEMGVKPENITMSRWYNGPYPYVAGAADAEIYNRPLSEICEEVEVGNYDFFLSHHSNALTDGKSTNYPLMIYRGTTGQYGDLASGSRDMAMTCWPLFYTNKIDPMTNYSPTNPNVVGDITFYGSSSTRTDPNTGKQYTGYLGVLKHGAPGFLVEGYFHTYQPARHRALNEDYCHEEGMRIARGMGQYLGLEPLKTGIVMGTVKDLRNHLVDNLYTYSAGTMDQWAPLDGAVVTLYKNGTAVDTYTTDNNKNGVFFFDNVEPGTYTIGVAAEGFKALGDYTDFAVDAEWKNYIAEANTGFTVEANKTTYPVALLEQEGYVPSENMFPNYREPDLPSYISAPQELTLTVDEGTEYALDGTIKRMLVRGDSTVVLTNAADGTPHLYLIDNVQKTLIKELSINGVAPTEPNNAGYYSRLNDIAYTSDGKLVGANCLQTQFGPEQVKAGFERGTLRIYKWDDFDSDPVEWVTTQSSANFYYYRPQALTIDGPSNECLITFLGVNDGVGTAGGMRFLKLNIVNNNIVSTTYTEKTISANSNFTQAKIGNTPILVMSPRSDAQVFIDGEATLPMEVDPADANGVDSEVVGRFAGNDADNAATGVSFFKYAQHQYMVTPYMNEANVAGIKLFDITNGVDQATLVRTTNTDLAPAACQFMSTGASVKGEDIYLYLMQDNKITKWMADADKQPAVRGIYAFGLTAEENDGSVTFSFNANDNAEEAYITFYDADGNELGSYTLPPVTEGENSVIINNSELPDGEFTWAITLEGKAITTIQRINPVYDTYSGNLYVAVDKSPCSKHMGTIYSGIRIGSANAGNGYYVCDNMGKRVSDKLYQGGRIWGNNTRFNLDWKGTLYLSDWSDGYSGVVIADPDNLDGTWQEFFVGTRNSAGLITNNGVAVASSAPCVYIGGKGADTKMYLYVEDMKGATSGAGNNVAVYNIGNEDGTVMTSWGEAPSNFYDLGAYELNGNGNIIADGQGRGVWVAQYRSAGQNNGSVPSLLFVDNNGTILLNCGKSPVSDMLNGSLQGGFAVSADDNMLVMNDGDGVLQFFDVAWTDGVPSLTHKYSYKADARKSNGAILQMAFDYAGNLVCAGANIGIYSLPTDANVHTTPYCGMLNVTSDPTAVSETVTAKTVVAERYFDIRGIEYSQPIDGVNIIVRTYSDGTTQSVKVMK